MYQINKNISKLQYLSNKADFEWKVVYEISNGLWHIIPFLEKDKINYRVDRYGHYMSIDLSNISKNKKNHFVYDGNYGLNDSIVNKIFDDKIITTKILSNNGIKTPNELLLIKSDSIFSNSDNGYKALLKLIETIWYPIICKPLSDMKGKGIMKINDNNWLKQFWEKFELWEFGNRHYIAQQYIAWNDCRVLFLDWEVLIAYQRAPAQVSWDGRSTILELISKNDIFMQNIDSISSYLNIHDYNIDDILEDKQILQILPTANISTWWTAKIIKLTEQDIERVRKIGKIWGANYFGLDVIYDDNIKDWYVIEINKSPGIMGIASVDENFASYFWQKVLDAIKKSAL